MYAPPQRISGPLRAAGVLAVTAPLLAFDASAQEPQDLRDPPRCEAGRIAEITVDNYDVFEPDDVENGGSFRWAYSLANALHVRTSTDFIRDELLFEVGDCYDPVRLEESERLLRGYGFISDSDVSATRSADGSWHVVVETQDEWTTKVEVNVNLEEGFSFRGAEITEEHLFGHGYLVGGFFREHEQRRDLGARFRAPRLFGTRTDLQVMGGRTRTGEFFEQGLFYPFVGEVGRVAFRQVVILRDELFPYVLPTGQEFSHLLLPLEEERIELSGAVRFGEPGDLTSVGLALSNETLDFPDYPGSVEAAREEDFGNTEPAPEGAADDLAAQTLHSSATRVSLLFGQRNIRFVQRTGLDALTGVQDVQVGTDLALTLGRSLDFLSSGRDQPDDLYGRFRLTAATAPRPFLLTSALALEGRQVFAGGDTGDGWREVLAELDGLVYWQPGWAGDHTFVGRVSGAGGWDVHLPYQLTLGGPDGLRGYDEDAFPGGRRLVVSLEDRAYLEWPFPDLFDLGLTVFGDVGRMWAGDAPFGADSQWKAAAGTGLRIGFPAGTRGVVRVDVAYPIESGVGFGDGMIRISLEEVLGLAGGLEDEQLGRSRRITIGPDLLNPPR